MDMDMGMDMDMDMDMDTDMDVVQAMLLMLTHLKTLEKTDGQKMGDEILQRMDGQSRQNPQTDEYVP